jgi:hypothetical protein
VCLRDQDDPELACHVIGADESTRLSASSNHVDARSGPT